MIANNLNSPMSLAAIDRVLYEAKLKNLTVILQKEEKENGIYVPIIAGKIENCDIMGVYINNQKIDYDEIRFVEICQ